MPDEQLSLFGDLGTSRHKRVLNQQQTQPVTDAPAKPQYDPNQLQLLVNPTEQVARTHQSTDTMLLSRFDSYGLSQEDVDKVGAPNEHMRRLGAMKEYESKQTYGHGSGTAEIFESGEQVRNPIDEFIEGEGPEDRRQWEGHHRLFAGAAYERDNNLQGAIWMPIRYTDKTPPPLPPSHTKGGVGRPGRRQEQFPRLEHSDVQAGIKEVHPDAGLTDKYRFQDAALDANEQIDYGQKWQGRPKRGKATNRQDALQAAVIRRRGALEGEHMGARTAVQKVDKMRGRATPPPRDARQNLPLRGKLGSPQPAFGRQQPDESEQRRVQDESMARRLNKHQALVKANMQGKRKLWNNVDLSEM